MIFFKIDNFQMILFYIFRIFAQNIDCGYTLEPPRRGGSNEYPQSMFWSKNKKNRYTPANPSFFYIKVGFRGVKITRTCFHDEILSYPQAKTKILTVILVSVVCSKLKHV